ncbi:RNA polymerase sigma factor [Fervidibacter sacchari]|uniref:RNA polymerase sigma factor n=1 Tax=Candidatus Fervidibacter sacchari TaxID=1448929 RepID=A0ABT2EPC3_9BACT|nr:RNA polymerase sigma factor [Candidatus Fervidibacter sacchari]MCS3919804.1 RNA polymerase sigma factor (sigma-70 family) [Candidatus Fervidibacter sacchari]WKU16955.1 RNA polymerase sigma factor [Candidatus Fervidibacter sacchari]
MRHWRDKWLVQRVLSGDKAAGEQFVVEHYEAIFRFLRNLTGSKEDAEDLTQQTFLRAWEALSSFRGDSSLSTWLHSIAYREYTHWLRSRREFVPLDEIVDMPDEQANQNLEAVLLRWAIYRLDPEHREVFVLHYVQGFSVSEIAKIVGVPAGTVKSRLFFARQKLRELLSDIIPEPIKALGKNYQEVLKMAVRIAEVTVTPSPLRPGSSAHAKCRVEADAPVRRVYALLPDGSTVTFRKVSETEFELSEQVPWDAPSGTYPVTLVAETETGERATLATSITIA